MTASGEERNNVFKYLRKEGSVPSGRVSQCYLSGNGYCSHFTGFGGGECRSHISYYSFLDRRRFVPPAHKVEKDTAAVCRRQLHRGWALALLQWLPNGEFVIIPQNNI